MNFINIFFFYFFLLLIPYIYSVSDCTNNNYSGIQNLEVSSFIELDCAIQYGVSTITVMSDISFTSTITVPNGVTSNIIGGKNNVPVTTVDPSSDFYKLLILDDTTSKRLFMQSDGTVSFLTFSYLILDGLNDESIHFFNLDGGLFYVSSFSSLTLSYCIGKDSYAHKGGVFYSLPSSIITITNSYFNNNDAYGDLGDSNGGVGFLEESYLYVSNSFFQNNAATFSSGGVFYLELAMEVKIEDSTFQSNKARTFGGSISALNSTNIIINNTIFKNDISVLNGGSISLQYSQMQSDNIQFYLNTAEYGAALYGTGSTFIITDSVFTNNLSLYGSSVYMIEDSVFQTSGTNFIKNFAKNEGGAISLINSIGDIIDCNFDSNGVDLFNPLSIGGSINGQYTNLNIQNVMFFNSTSYKGTDVYLFNGNLDILNVEIYQSNGADGMIYCANDCSLNLKNGFLHDNFADQSSSGIVCFSSLACDVSDTTLINSSAGELGVINIDSSDFNLYNITISDNISGGLAGAIYLNSVPSGSAYNLYISNNIAGNYGGALTVDSDSTIYLENIYMFNNTAVSGGGIYIFDECNVETKNLTFYQNIANDSGGGVYLGGQSFLRLYNSTFIENTAPYGGGVYSIFNSTIEIDDCNFLRNKSPYAGGAIGLFNSITANIVSSNFINNTASIGGAISTQYYIQMTVEDSRFFSNEASDFGGCIYSIVSCTANILSSDFNRNFAQFGGGVFFVETSALTVDSSTFFKNSASTGGVLQAIQASIESIRSIYNSNGRGFIDTFSQWEVPSSYQGGTFYIVSDSTFYTDSNFFNNGYSLSGGIMSTLSSIAYLNNDIFEDCYSMNGACILSMQSSRIIASNITFHSVIIPRTRASVVYVESGSITFESSSFKNNIVSSNAVLSVSAADMKVLNSVFYNNTVLGTTPNGGAIFMQNTLVSSEDEDDTDDDDAYYYYEDTDYTSRRLQIDEIQAFITNTTFELNRAVGGFGGAIYANGYPGNVFVSNNIFKSNTANNGAAVSIKSTVVTLDDNYFERNIAFEGGGAIFWIYNTIRLTEIHDNNIYHNNIAAYGNNSATDLVYLFSQFDNSTQVSGKALSSPIKVYLYDYYDQIVTVSSLNTDLLRGGVSIYATVFNNTGILKGSSIVSTVLGVAEFSQLILTGSLDTPTTIAFSAPISGINSTTQLIYFRNCISGEVSQDLGDGLFSCYECTLGTYSFYPTDTVCNICPANADCPGKNVIDVHKDFWRVNSVSSNVLQCNMKGVCLGGTDPETQCAEGYEGPYCSVCADGYSSSSDGECYQCSDPSGDQAVGFSLFVSFLIFCFIIYKFRKNIINFYSRMINKIAKNRKFRSLSVKLKIIVSFIQIICQMGPAFSIVFPANFSNFLGAYSFLDFNFAFIPKFGCIINTNFYHDLVISTISPIVLFLICFVVIRLMVIYAKRMNERNPFYLPSRAKRDTISVAFLISYFVLVSVSTNIFQVFQCETFDDGTSYLVADYSIDCHDSDRIYFIVYGILMILVYPLGIPFTYAYLLVKNRKLINPDWRKVIDTNEKKFVSNKVIQKEKIKVRKNYKSIQSISNLYDSYVPKRWYFELFDCARRLMLGAVPVLIFRGSLLQIIIVLLISLFSVASFMHFNPYIHVHDNHLAVLAQWSITFIIISALVVRVEKIENSNGSGGGSGDSVIFGVLLILLNVIVLGVTIFSIFYNTKVATDEGPKGLFGEDLEDLDEITDAYADAKEVKKKKIVKRPSDENKEENNNNNEDGEPGAEDDSEVDSDLGSETNEDTESSYDSEADERPNDDPDTYVVDGEDAIDYDAEIVENTQPKFSLKNFKFMNKKPTNQVQSFEMKSVDRNKLVDQGQNSISPLHNLSNNNNNEEEVDSDDEY